MLRGYDFHKPGGYLGNIGFNHQSNIDAILVTKMVRRDVIGVGKKELRVPLFGRIAEWAGTVFIDRSDPEKAIEALRPVVEEIHGGRSLVIAPEGTRSPTPRLGPFKKGSSSGRTAHVAQGQEREL